MKSTVKYGLITVLGIAAVGFAYWTIAPFFTTKTLNEALPNTSTMSAESVPVVATPNHPASGDVFIVTNEDGTRAIRYQDYSTLNGPDLFVYLAKDTEAREFVSLGRVRATEGSVMYAIPEDIDLAEYPFVLTYCRAFSTLFNYADLTPLLSQDEDTFCIQVITPARNPDTGAIVEFPTPCDVPDGWEPVLPEGLDVSLEVL